MAGDEIGLDIILCGLENRSAGGQEGSLGDEVINEYVNAGVQIDRAGFGDNVSDHQRFGDITVDRTDGCGDQFDAPGVIQCEARTDKLKNRYMQLGLKLGNQCVSIFTVNLDASRIGYDIQAGIGGIELANARC